MIKSTLDEIYLIFHHSFMMFDKKTIVIDQIISIAFISEWKKIIRDIE